MSGKLDFKYNLIFSSKKLFLVHIDISAINYHIYYDID